MHSGKAILGQKNKIFHQILSRVVNIS